MLREAAYRGAAGIAAWLLMAAVPAVAAADNGPARIDETPAIAGTLQVGRPLQASGSWRGGEPVTATWSWLRCSGLTLDTCVAIGGADATGYVPVDADAGSRLRVKLAVSNAKGWAWAVTAPSEIVAAAATPVPVVTPPPLPLLFPRPVVRIRGWMTPNGAHVTALTVSAPSGSRIVVRCLHGTCPRARWAHTASLVHVVPFQRALRAGTRLVVSVTKPGFVGKRTVLRIRRGAAPARVDRCLYPSAPTVRTCPS